MSTRCNVIIRKDGNQVVLYHHWDGYPEGVGYDLVERFRKNFQPGQPEWTMAGVVNMLIKDKEDQGYEWTTRLHGDIEYLYTVDLNRKTITCDDVDNWDGLKINQSWDMFEYQKNELEIEKRAKAEG